MIKLSNQQGQALVEFCGAFILVLSVVVSIGKLLREEWRQSLCFYHTFEETHAASIGQKFRRPKVTSGVVQDLGFSFRGVAQCGKRVEKVELPKLEAARW